MPLSPLQHAATQNPARPWGRIHFAGHQSEMGMVVFLRYMHAQSHAPQKVPVQITRARVNGSLHLQYALASGLMISYLKSGGLGPFLKPKRNYLLTNQRRHMPDPSCRDSTMLFNDTEIVGGCRSKLCGPYLVCNRAGGVITNPIRASRAAVGGLNPCSILRPIPLLSSYHVTAGFREGR